ncbi:MAG: hypothetical protein ACLFPE_12440, partial [Bacteroidales bacterium]
MEKYTSGILVLIIVFIFSSAPRAAAQPMQPDLEFETGAARTADYLPLLHEKQVAVVGNHTS